ncbi:MAG: DUF1622 domain-containing protein [Actinomycetota bacterium]|nr:DUF1622 domain-containing protein [Actinomycetota bacterium]
MEFKDTVESVGKALDLAGVTAIVGGILVATAIRARHLGRGEFREQYRRYRQAIGRAILLGLEILVGADIIRTIAVEPTFESVGVLALIVLVRTFLSFSLEVELEGRWPWQQRGAVPASASGPRAK